PASGAPSAPRRNLEHTPKRKQPQRSCPTGASPRCTSRCRPPAHKRSHTEETRNQIIKLGDDKQLVTRRHASPPGGAGRAGAVVIRGCCSASRAHMNPSRTEDPSRKPGVYKLRRPLLSVASLGTTKSGSPLVPNRCDQLRPEIPDLATTLSRLRGLARGTN